MEKVLVTGGCGFIGSHITEQLLKENYHVTILDNLSTGHLANIDGLPVDLHQEDITKPEAMELIKSINPDYIIHLAAQVSVAESVSDFLKDENINIRGSLHVIKAASECGVKKIIFASSAAVYGNPNYLPVDTRHITNPGSPYGLTKLTVENYLKLAYDLYGVEYCILRYSNVYGPRQDAKGEGGVVSIFSDLLTNGTAPVIFGDGEQSRDFIYVGDVAAANVNALKAQSNVCLNVSNGFSITVNELFAEMKKATNSTLSPVYRDERPGDIRHSTLCNEETKKILNWEPQMPLDKGLEKTISYYRKEMKA
ncbi:NAD-dependent epimerase/dehydratase family protein [Bacillus sonorensis]|mgnify:CR=1 FL=1|uniref:NAD-dependent epimerase/dehydratase n=1 Tax=Bacillus sonorensis L12 TaxID=1274524 RepID=M5PD06_9BACI|nr:MULTISPECIES: NAD-dependent epimerase/dehydratase family protein [Bacillus]TWK80549.1 UDP-glucose 4-epimerase [Bacillus paralicheniformis]EME73362.1 NAD-dependent epimerase/dehydratase [Bacillus sonorensis L12]MBG9914349.1 UDP-glucose 4-epimerase [Bacillus sonorensis]MCF7616406.1 NAD-dependent epimerase/dehydratase family protein [Bacillus sonorensis]MCY7857669.1 NAD-dependent epimerase/dehydratase family protein [Bacillus sonorensis]